MPKAGNSEEENEDAWAVAADRGRVAISDGASSAYRSGDWARLLCQSFVEEDVEVTAEAIGPWIVGVAQRFRDEPATPEPGWWGAEAAERGAYATLIGVHFSEGAHGTIWRSVAVGDSVIVQLRRHGDDIVVVAGFPIESGHAFSSTPALLGSTIAGPAAVPTLRFAHGSAMPGDRWLVMSDEVAHWGLCAHEDGRPIWSLLLTGTAAEVRAGIGAARASGAVVNDDMTLVRVEVS